MLAAFVTALPQATLVLHKTGRVLAANAVMGRALGFAVDPGGNLLDRLGPQGHRLRLRLLRAIRSTMQLSIVLEVNGQELPFQIWSFAMTEPGQKERLLVLQCDLRAVHLGETRDLRKQTRRLQATLRVSEISRARLLSETERLEFAATHDPATELLNAWAFEQRVSQALRSATPSGTMIYIDLNGFKAINDTHGHRAGDEVLVAVAGRIKALLRRSDPVARLGGDEFAVWLAGADDETRSGIGARLAQTIGAPIVLRGSGASVRVGAAIGLAQAPDDGSAYSAVLEAADKRMYRHKQAEKSQQGPDGREAGARDDVYGTAAQ